MLYFLVYIIASHVSLGFRFVSALCFSGWHVSKKLTFEQIAWNLGFLEWLSGCIGHFGAYVDMIQFDISYLVFFHFLIPGPCHVFICLYFLLILYKLFDII